MRSRSPIFVTALIVAVALLAAIWSWLGPDHTGYDRANSIPQNPGGVTALHQIFPTSARVSAGGIDAATPQAPPVAGESNQHLPNVVAAGGGGEGMSEQERRLARRDQVLARQAAIAAAQDPRLVAADQQPDGEDPGAAQRQQQQANQAAAATPAPSSIYQGLTNQELIDLLIALNRLRDAGVFQKLSPDQFHDVTQLMGDAEGVKDADAITRSVLDMPVGVWLDREMGPRGNFVME